MAAAAVCACDKATPEREPQPPVEDDGGFEEPEPDRPEYVNANLIYYGGDDMDGLSDYWVLNLYTDMEVMDGYPVGPGQFLSLAMNAPYNEAQQPSLESLVGQYVMPANSMDFSAGTFIQGEMHEIDLPGGSIMRPDGCFFGDIPFGETEFEPDLLREGSFTVLDNGDGTISDLATGLMWQKADSGNGMDWENSLSYAENLELAGYDDWRLPNAKELQSIVDYNRSISATNSAAIDPIFQISQIQDMEGNIQYPYFWSSTTHLDGNNPYSSDVYIAFGEAEGVINGKLMDVLRNYTKY